MIFLSRLRKRIPPKEGTTPQLKRVRSVRIPFSPSLIIEWGHHRIIAENKRILQKSACDGLFKRGDKVLYFHLEATDRTAAHGLVNKMVDNYTKKTLRESGFVGIYADTPNNKALDYFVKKGFIVTKEKTPILVNARERVRYAKNVLVHGYPKKYLTAPMQRVALKF